MQHTKFDRWLCKKLVHTNHIYFNTMPEGLPDDLDLEEAPPESGARYKYRATTRSEEIAKEACATFSEQNITYTARVEERDNPLARFVGNPRRSVTMLLLSIFLLFLSIAFAISGIPQAFIARMLMDKEPVTIQKNR